MPWSLFCRPFLWILLNLESIELAIHFYKELEEYQIDLMQLNVFFDMTFWGCSSSTNLNELLRNATAYKENGRIPV